MLFLLVNLAFPPLTSPISKGHNSYLQPEHEQAVSGGWWAVVVVVAAGSAGDYWTMCVVLTGISSIPSLKWHNSLLKGHNSYLQPEPVRAESGGWWAVVVVVAAGSVGGYWTLCVVSVGKRTVAVYWPWSETQWRCSRLSTPSAMKAKYCNDHKFSDRQVWANRVDPDQSAPEGTACVV